jgi:hypothetical protein
VEVAGAAARDAAGAANLTIGSSHLGSAIDRTGAASALRRPSVHTKCRADAEARRSDAATSAVAARITDALTMASRTIGSEMTLMA